MARGFEPRRQNIDPQSTKPCSLLTLGIIFYLYGGVYFLSRKAKGLEFWGVDFLPRACLYIIRKFF
jgi:hypothetical protein